jgi:hypothetical protein
MKNQSLLRENFRMKFFIAAAFVFLFNPFLQAQQLPLWTVPNKQIKFPSLTVTNLPSADYTGAAAQYAHNVMHDIQGNLSFFIVDGTVYDKNGSLIGDILNPTTGGNVTGITEWLIVPAPGSNGKIDCKKYYLIGGNYNSPTGPGGQPEPYYILLDMGVQNSGAYGNPNAQGDFIGLSGAGDPTATHLPGVISQALHNGSLHFAVSKYRPSTNDYFLFISDAVRIMRITISASGFSSPVNIMGTLYMPFSNNSAGARNEMELVQLPGGATTNYRIALGYGTTPPTGTSKYKIFVGNIDFATGNLIGSPTVIDLPFISLTVHAFPHGLEFSSDGRFLYVAHTEDPYLQYVDLNSSSVLSPLGPVTSPNITSSQAQDFQLTQIELGNDQYMYFGSSSGMARLFPSTNPTSATWENAVPGLPPVPVSSGGFSSTNANNIRLLNDQIDGENLYNLLFAPGAECCVEHSIYDQTNFIAPASATWTGGFNPINNGAGATVTIKEELRIPSGITVTIDNMIFQFAPTGYVVIEQGAKLILNRTTFTIDDRCEKQMWGGIQVWGTTNQNQFPSGNPTFQGIIHLTDNSVIEHAWNAITTWKPNDWNTRGGVVVASNSTFNNNKRSVEFMSYHNTFPSSGAPFRNLSSFYDVTFTVDDNFLGNSFNTHVTMWDVNGVYFRWCKFENNQTNKIFSTTENKGIFSIDAGYIVGASCNILPPPNQPCPPASLLRSSFKGFNHAVHAVGTGTLYTVNVDQSDFDENVYGVYMEGSNNFSATRSNYIIGGNNASGVWLPIRNGIYTNVSTGYRIEENNMSNAAFPLGLMIGFWVRNSGHADNQVYKNSSRNIDIGEIGHGLNRNPNYAFNGLQILCNTHVGVKRNDIYVAKDLSGRTTDHGIRQFQGDPSKSAGNVFSHMNLPESDFANKCDWVIDYFHTGGMTEPLTYTQYMVNPFQITTANTCPSRFNNDSEKLTETERQDLSDEYDNQELSYVNLLYNYNQLMDGGDQNALLTQIQLSWPADAWDLRDELMSHAPYLSQDVLREAAMRDILPHAMLLEICLANPDATKSDEFLYFLQYDIPTPMPLYMIDLIRANWDTETARTLLEGGMAHFSGEMAGIANLLANDYTKDEEPNFNQIRYWLGKGSTLTDKYVLAESYLESGDYSVAENILNDIPNQFELRDHEIIEHDNYMYYFNFRKDVNDSGRTIGQLTSSEIDMLNFIVENHTGRSKVFAQNILCFFYSICADAPELTLDGGESRLMHPGTLANEVMTEKLITVSPNPASSFTTITWSIPAYDNSTFIEIFDVVGKKIQSYKINDIKGQWIWDTRRVKNGFYFYELRQNNKPLKSGKIIVNN